MSMHQPWASLLVHGFKRFEGREWTHKYRGPLWIHSTAQKPSQDLIDDLESKYKEFYKSLGEELPEFPERYPTSVVLGRVDLIDIITLDEYKDTVP
jgi:activating signal cointegrator 1